jgi:hypothetical protein
MLSEANISLEISADRMEMLHFVQHDMGSHWLNEYKITSLTE